ncbi:hypothetical protein EMIHUDRAFT_207984 [Emiliania huxleyi CCMP1516]|uniref:FIST domain-containing protein n=2 Tax=Emiliania huxleyi TaxID=2903 RepID=A0A0D3JBQ9_EMIH1|nr:hypothetical protein EMIHUDRAFT_207984 [Emiliania huxleyi CCMP1516]EOD20944.1 hypothetical protein EMIHUDRAFT_207984 [Emiliania huxleyi CCMP1516]|eukprot:XP_005773373.1 hypothetical protein EMIHUDRAFT_207984 [Emiliania huxleyi CCMP1516]
MRLSSLTACGPGAAAELASKVRALKADAVVWFTESSQPAELAVALADSAESVVGAVTTQGLIGGGGEHSRSLGSASMPGVPYSFSPSPEAERTVALAISGLSGGASLLPWHSPPDGLPDLPEAFWTDHASLPATITLFSCHDHAKLLFLSREKTHAPLLPAPRPRCTDARWRVGRRRRVVVIN